MIRKLIKRVFGRADNTKMGLQVIPAGEHGIKVEQLTACAVKVTRTLQEAGFKAYIVGGAVRDLLLGQHPKDFDVATDATPEEVTRLFRRSRIIGRRFRIVHVLCGAETIEVTTFRANQNTEDEGVDRVTDETGRIVRDNVFGSQEDDASRRDFTVNALYYDPQAGDILDYCNGVHDVHNRTLRMIGDPETRYREDPVRMLRAVRFAAKLDFRIDPETRAPVAELAGLIENIPSSRLFDEMLKLLLSGHAARSLHQLRTEGLHHGLLPMLDVILEQPRGEKFVNAALHNTDQRIQQGKPVSPAFLFAALLWHEVLVNWEVRKKAGEKPFPALQKAMDEVGDRQEERLAIPKRFSVPMREIWAMQPRFEQRSGGRPYRLVEHPRFRAAYDFLLLRAESGEIDVELADWWTCFPKADETERAAMLLREPPAAGKGPRRRRRRKPAAAGGGESA